VPHGREAEPIPATLGFRAITKQGVTNLIRVSCRAELVDCARGLLVVPDREEGTIAVILAKWREEDNARIASQPPAVFEIVTPGGGGITLQG